MINPNWSDPRFFNRSRGDLRVFELVGGQRFSSPTIGSANPLIDVGRSVTTADATDESSTLAPMNLLINGDFEAGLAGWSTNNAASTQTSTPTAFRGAAYFAAGEVVVGTASQTIDLVAQQIDIAAVDAGALRINFGGRLRNADETSPDRGKITVEMIDESGVVLTSAEVSASGQTDRWELIGAQRAIAPGTRTLRYSFVSTRNSGQTSDAYLDGAFARIIDLSYRLRAGAHAASPVESDPTAQPTIAIRFPDLYTQQTADHSMGIK